MHKSWKDCDFEECLFCGSDIQVLTSCEKEGWVQDGDVVRCRSCYCQGWMDVGEYEDTVIVQWPDEPCAQCYRDMERN